MPEPALKFQRLSGFQLKYFAAILMVLDHIYISFEFTGKVPVLFSMLGRMSAPLFVFCLVEGFLHTRNRKKYFFTIYTIAIGMGLLQYFFIVTGFARPDGYYPKNQMLSTMAVLLVILQGLDWCAQKKWLSGLCAAFVPLILPHLATQVSGVIPCSKDLIDILSFTILPLHSRISDGGTAYVLLGILMYVFHSNRKLQAAVFSVYMIFIYAVLPFAAVPEFTIYRLFTDSYHWMGVFAAVPMLMYNGERGAGNKLFFYWFYPSHVYILFAVSWGLYLMLQR
jgi:hypothetical protein